MLVLKLFTVYDIKAEVHFPPFAVGNAGEAVRAFSDLLADPQSKLSKHPNDYRLYHVGEFHVDTGIVVPLFSGVVLVEDGLALVREA